MSARIWLGSLLLVGIACAERPVDKPVPTDAAARFAEVICEREAACGCMQYDSYEACVSSVVDAFNEVAPEMLGFDEDCFESHLKSGVFQDCPGGDWSIELLEDCSVFHGRRGTGEPCSSLWLVDILSANDQCEEGLYCIDTWGVCGTSWDTLPPPKSAGDPCDPSRTSPCRNENLYCDGEFCRNRVAAGEPCTHDRACDIYDYCEGLTANGQGVCSPIIDIGDPCDPDDWANCMHSTTGWTWCDPGTATCVNPIPRICAMVVMANRD